MALKYDCTECKKQITPERLADLEKSERKLIALETAGVDNWSGYQNAIDDLDDEEQLRAVARQFLVPMLDPPASPVRRPGGRSRRAPTSP